MNSFFRHIKHALITLRFSILSIFVTLFVAAILLIIAINYSHSSRTLSYTATNLLDESSTSFYNEFSKEINKAEHDDTFSATLIQGGVLKPNDLNEMTNYTFDLAYQFNLIESAYWANTNGTVVSARYENDDSITTEIIDRETTPPTKKYIYRDVKGNVIKIVNSNDLSYDPRNRPWYVNAKKAKRTIWTDIYQYREHRYLGISVATPVYLKNNFAGVFSLDIRLDWLSWYMSEQKISKNGIVFIVTDEGKMIAYPKLYQNTEYTELVDIHTLDRPWIATAFDNYKKNKNNNFHFKYQNNTYLASFKKMPQFAMHGWLIGIVAPEDDFTGDLKIADIMDVGIGLIILVVGIFMVSKLVTLVVKPIKKLVKQTEKIRRFDLEESSKIKTRIKEVSMLSDSISRMRSGLKSFIKYVPAMLVRQLIETGEDAVIGGAKKQLTILFSDIENFTTLAEHMDPNLLMEHMCEYFSEMSKIITAEKATIDKFIGDSIMAFWGAPIDVDQPCQRAARAALECAQRLRELNEKWKQSGKPPLFTRIGIHTGEAIVGNLGSIDRLNYTALGDTINIASRLEAINKIYHTHIIVSDAVYQVIKDEFLLRKIDRVALKGKLQGSDIYELLAPKNQGVDFDLNQYQPKFESGFIFYQQQNWEQAIELFKECINIYPDDYIAPLFIKRCHEFKLEPPKDWDGIWRYF